MQSRQNGILKMRKNSEITIWKAYKCRGQRNEVDGGILWTINEMFLWTTSAHYNSVDSKLSYEKWSCVETGGQDIEDSEMRAHAAICDLHSFGPVNLVIIEAKTDTT